MLLRTNRNLIARRTREASQVSRPSMARNQKRSPRNHPDSASSFVRWNFRFGKYPLTVGTRNRYSGKECLSRLGGHLVFSWRHKPLPRITDILLDCVVYLYPTVQ